MVSKTTVIKNPSGLHLRPAGVLCKEALRYKSKISFKVRTTTANAKSVLSVLGASEYQAAGDKERFPLSCMSPRTQGLHYPGASYAYALAHTIALHDLFL